MTTKTTANSLTTITRRLTPAACQLAQVALADDQKITPPLKNVLIDVLLSRQRLEPLTRLAVIFAELLILSTFPPKTGAVMKRSVEVWIEIDRMEARETVSEALVWWAVVRNIVDADLDPKNVTVH